MADDEGGWHETMDPQNDTDPQVELLEHSRKDDAQTIGENISRRESASARRQSRSKHSRHVSSAQYQQAEIEQLKQLFADFTVKQKREIEYLRGIQKTLQGQVADTVKNTRRLSQVASSRPAGERKYDHSDAKWDDEEEEEDNLEDLILSGDRRSLSEALSQACKGGDVEKVRRLTGDKNIDLDMDYMDSEGWTPLTGAGWRGITEIVDMLLSHDPPPSVNKTTDDGWTSMHEALWFGHREIVALLLAHDPPVNINCLNSINMTPLMTAVSAVQVWGSVDAVLLILNNDPAPDLDHQDGNGETALDIAKKIGLEEEKVIGYIDGSIPIPKKLEAANLSAGERLIVDVKAGNLAAVKKCVEENRKYINFQDKLGFTALTHAAFIGHYEMVKFFIENGADVDLRKQGASAGSYSASALMSACDRGNYKIVKYLVEIDPTPDIVNDHMCLEKNLGDAGYTVVMFACKWGFKKILRLLLKYSTPEDLNKQYIHEKSLGLDDNNGTWTPLLIATKYGKAECVKILMKFTDELDLDLEHKETQQTALLWASKLGFVEIAKLILDYPRPPNVNVRDKEKRTALMHASDRGSDSIVKALLASKASVDWADDDGMTALMFAARKGHYQAVVELDIADPNIVNKKKETALILASEGGYADIVEILLKRGAEAWSVAESEWTALTAACSAGHAPVIKHLLKAKLEGRNFGFFLRDWTLRSGDTPKDMPKYDGRSEGEEEEKEDGEGGKKEEEVCTTVIKLEEMVLRKLTIYDDDINFKDKDGMTPLMTAAYYGFNKILVALLEKDADVNMIDLNLNGRTALMWAAEAGQNRAIQLLLEERRTDMEVRDLPSKGTTDGRLAEDIARDSGESLSVMYLQEATGERLPATKVIEQATIELPDSIYATPILMPLIYHREAVAREFEHISEYGAFFNIVFFYSLTVLNFVAQFSFLYYVIIMVREREDEEDSWCEAPFMLNLVALFVYVAVAVIDVYESVTMGLYLYWFPNADGNKDKEELVVQVEDNLRNKNIVSGIPTWYKIFCFAFVVIPKMCVAVVLIGYGAGFVVSSPDIEDVLLNTLAVNFILEIDEVLFNAFISEKVREVLDDLPGVPAQYTDGLVSATTKRTLMELALSKGYSKLIVVCIAVVCVWFTWCEGTDADSRGWF